MRISSLHQSALRAAWFFTSPSQMTELALLIEQEGILGTSQEKWEGRTSSRQDSDIKDGTQV